MGYIVSFLGVHIELENIQSIQNWLKTKTIKKIPDFIRFANFFRWFILNFSALTRPIISMLKTGPGSRVSKLMKKKAKTLFQLLETLFLNPKAINNFLKVGENFLQEVSLVTF